MLNLKQLNRIRSIRRTNAKVTFAKVKLNELSQGYFTNRNSTIVNTDFYQTAKREEQLLFDDIFINQSKNMKHIKTDIYKLIDDYRQAGINEIVNATHSRDEINLMNLRLNLKYIIDKKGEI